MHRQTGYLILLACLIPMGLAFLIPGNQDRFILYADPWLEPFLEATLKTWQNEHPETETEIRYLSSEVILQHHHYGQPLDLMLLLEPGASQADTASFQHNQYLAGLNLARVKVRQPKQVSAFRTEGCLLFAATGRPLHDLSTQWIKTQKLSSPECLIYGNFYTQMRDYLLRGWIPEGIVYGFFAAQHPDLLTVTDTWSPDGGAAAMARIPHAAPHPEAAQAFLTLLVKNKLGQLLDGSGSIP